MCIQILLKCHSDAAEAALRVAQGNHEDMLDRLKHFVEGWKRYLAERTGSGTGQRDVMPDLWNMIEKDISGIVDPLGQRNVYLQEVYKR